MAFLSIPPSVASPLAGGGGCGWEVEVGEGGGGVTQRDAG